MAICQTTHTKKLMTQKNPRHTLLTEIAFICICLDRFLGRIVNNPTMVMDNDKMSILLLMDFHPLNAVTCEVLLAWLKTLLGVNITALQQFYSCLSTAFCAIAFSP